METVDRSGRLGGRPSGGSEEVLRIIPRLAPNVGLMLGEDDFSAIRQRFSHCVGGASSVTLGRPKALRLRKMFHVKHWALRSTWNITDGKNNRDCQSKRRRRQDHDRHQSGCLPRSERLRVLLIDSDPQGNATLASESPKARTARLSIKCSSAKRISRPPSFQPSLKASISSHRTKTWWPPISNWWNYENREFRLREKIEPIRAHYDFILIDCPPALDLLTLNAMVAADSILIPIQCEFFALEGISQLMDTIERVREILRHAPSRSKACCLLCTTTAPI